MDLTLRHKDLSSVRPSYCTVKEAGNYTLYQRKCLTLLFVFPLASWLAGSCFDSSTGFGSGLAVGRAENQILDSRSGMTSRNRLHDPKTQSLGKAWRSFGSATPDTAVWGCSPDIPVWREADHPRKRMARRSSAATLILRKCSLPQGGRWKVRT